MFCSRRRALALFFAVFFAVAPTLMFPAAGGAEEPLPTAEIPEDVPPLPGARDTERPLYLSNHNAALFHELLLAPLAAWLKNGKFVMRVVRDLPYRWMLSAAWEKASGDPLAARFRTDDSGNLSIGSENGAAVSGFPFGRAAQVNREPDPVLRARKILWNAEFAQALSKDLLLGFDLEWFNSQMILRKSSGTFYRESYLKPFTAALPAGAFDPELSSAGPESGPKPLLRREYLHLNTPPVVLGYSAVTWRFLDSTEDLLWLFSPVLGRSRQVMSSNRSDPLLGGLLTLDDLFVFSPKIQTMHASVVEEKTLLVPFSALAPLPLQKEPMLDTPSSVSSSSGASSSAGAAAEKSAENVLSMHGAQRRKDGQPVSVLWNADIGSYPQSSAWIPSTVVFVPRRVWIVEVSPKDPYYTTGRAVVVVDQELMLPVYKVVYDCGGSYSKMVIGSWNLAMSESGDVRFSVPSFVLAVDRDEEKAMAFTVLQARTFLGVESPAVARLREGFDIGAAGKKGADAGQAPASSVSSGSRQSVDTSGAID